MEIMNDAVSWFRTHIAVTMRYGTSSPSMSIVPRLPANIPVLYASALRPKNNKDIQGPGHCRRAAPQPGACTIVFRANPKPVILAGLSPRYIL